MLLALTRRLFFSAAFLGLLAGSAGRSRAAFVDFTTIPDGSATSFSLNGVTVTGSASVTSGSLAGNRGLGITGGGSSLSVDLGETLTIDYNQLVRDVTVRIVDVDPAGNINYSFQAFNGATSLGVFAVPVHTAIIETKNLSALAGNVPFTRITLFLTTSGPPIGLQVQATDFTPVSSAVPEPSSLALCGVAALAGLGGWWRRRAGIVA